MISHKEQYENGLFPTRHTTPVKHKLSIIGNSTKIFAIRPDIQHQWSIHYQS